MRELQRARQRILRRVRSGVPKRFECTFRRFASPRSALYEGTLRSAMLALKDGRRDVAEALGRAVARLVPQRIGVLVPIPTTARRRRVRGIDGVALVARYAAAIAGRVVLAALEQRAGDAQRGRSRADRLAAHGRFACAPLRCDAAA